MLLQRRGRKGGIKEETQEHKKLAIPRNDKISSFVEEELETESDSFYLR